MPYQHAKHSKFLSKYIVIMIRITIPLIFLCICCSWCTNTVAFTSSFTSFNHHHTRAINSKSRNPFYGKNNIIRQKQSWLFSEATPSPAQKENGPSQTQANTAASKPSLEDLIAQTRAFEAEALACLQSSQNSKEVELFRVAFLGKNGKITGMMKEMKVLSASDKPKLGEVVNKAKAAVEEAIELAKKAAKENEIQIEIENDSLGNTFQIPSAPYLGPSSGHRHPLSLVLDLTSQIFQEIGYEVISDVDDSPEIENDFFNFEALGMPPSHPARDMQDTFYIKKDGIKTNETLLLRTHTSAVQIREMEKRKPPFKIVVPGRVYRKDDVDATHYPIFHQVEILAIDEYGKLSIPHLLGTVKYFLRKMFGPDIEVKYRASYFPFTEPSIEVDVFFRGRWLEVLGCGMVDPAVLEAVGYDPLKYSGFAAGFGVERFAMIMHQIPDIRLFWENNVEFLQQFPSMPYGIPGDDDEERLKDEALIGNEELEDPKYIF